MTTQRHSNNSTTSMTTDPQPRLSNLWSGAWTRRHFLGRAAAGAGVLGLGGALAACGGGDTSNNSDPDTLVLGINGGTTYENMYNAALKHFEEEYNVKIVTVFGDGTTLLNKVLAEKNNPTMDVVVTYQGGWEIGKAEGVFEKVNYDNIPNMGDIYDFLKDPDGYAPYVNLGAWGIVYNRETVSEPPTSFRQLWEPKYKGQIMIGGTYHYQIHLAAFAHAWTGDQKQIDTAFDKVKELMPNVSAFYGLSSDGQAKFQEGVGQIATWYSYTAQRLRALGVPLEFQPPEEGSFLYPSVFQVVKGTKKKELAEKLIGQFFAPDTCLELAEKEGFIPANKTVTLDDELQKQLLTYDQVLASNQWDWNFVNQNQSAWLTRWNAEINPLLNA